VRFGLGRDPELSLLRVTSLPADRPLMVGPFCCSPTGPGLDVAFQPLRIGAPDPALHAE
jgi:regulation of enolase protein 1 (concanavalin A-like superfamily)